MGSLATDVDPALGIDEVPPEFDWNWPDPDCGRPLELADLTYDELDALPATTPARYREPAWPIDPPSLGATRQLTGSPARAEPPSDTDRQPRDSSATPVTWPDEMDQRPRDASAAPHGWPSETDDRPGDSSAAPRGWPSEMDCRLRDGTSGGAGFAGAGALDTAPAGALAGFTAEGQPADPHGWPGEMDCWLRDGTGGGAGFADGGVLDTAPAGLALAGFTTDAQAQLGTLTDDELTGVIRAWRRLSSWASAGELQAIAALARRRPADGTPPAAPGEPFPGQVSEFVGEEVAAALTLTPISGDRLTGLAMDLAGRLAPVRDVLAAGWIDLSRARLFAQATEGLTDAHAAAVVAAVLPQAPELTSGRLRRALDRAVLAADPGSAQKQRDAALAQARVDCWPDPCGTANLAGRNLPAASVLAADKRLDAIARAWQAAGATGGIDQLRARAYLAQLLDQDTTRPPADLLAPPILTTQPDPRGQHSCPPPTPSQPPCTPRPSSSHQRPPAPAPAGPGSPPTQQRPPSSLVPPGQTSSDHRPLAPAPAGPSRPPTQQHPPGSPAPPGQTRSDQRPATPTPTRACGPSALQHPPGSPVPPGQTRSDQPPATPTQAGPGSPPTQQHPPSSPASPGNNSSHPPGQPVPAGLHPPPPPPLPPLAGSVNLTIPLLTLLSLADRPGEVPGYGPLDPGTARALACAAAGHRATRWHLTLSAPRCALLYHPLSG